MVSLGTVQGPRRVGPSSSKAVKSSTCYCRADLTRKCKIESFCIKDTFALY